jgi:protein Tob/BTG
LGPSITAIMQLEVHKAVDFMTELCRHDLSAAANEDAIQAFKTTLTAALLDRFDGHWFVENPIRGQAYRCVQHDAPRCPDTAVKAACAAAGIALSQSASTFTLWVDPGAVSARLGRHGGIFNLDLHSTSNEELTSMTSLTTATTVSSSSTTSASPTPVSPVSKATKPRASSPRTRGNRALRIFDPVTLEVAS